MTICIGIVAHDGVPGGRPRVILEENDSYVEEEVASKRS